MKIINYISIIAMPMVIFIIISEALKEIICFYWNAKKLWNFGFYY